MRLMRSTVAAGASTSREKFPFALLNYHSFEPHNRDSALLIGMALRHAVISSFPGTDEKEKLGIVFASAPPWLIWFTFADYTAELLGLTLPDISSVTGLARSKANFDRWHGLPNDAFEPSPWANGTENEPLARTDLNLLRPAPHWPDSQMTPRQRRRERAIRSKSHPIKRTDDWPDLLASELLEESVRTLIT
jgi:hypothetical protein